MEILQEVISFLRTRKVEAYLVGGWVRDRVLGRTDNRDIDIALKGDAIGLARGFANLHHGAFYLMDETHRVARALFGQAYVDFAELRGDVTADLSNRDFTINAMALAISAQGLTDGSPEALARSLIDPFHGWNDIQARLVRVVSDDVFRNDPIRLLRAPRLASSFDFAIEPHTLELMRRDAALLAAAPMERARDELFKILGKPEVVGLLTQLDELGLLAALVPELNVLKGVEQSLPHEHDVFDHSIQTVNEIVRIQASGYANVAHGAFIPELQTLSEEVISGERTRGLLLRLIALLHDVGKAATRSIRGDGRIHFYDHEGVGAEMAEGIFRRLRMSNGEIDIAARAIKAHLRPLQLARESHTSNRALYRFFRDTRDAGVDVCVLALADLRAHAAPRIDPVMEAKLDSTLSKLLSAYYRFPEKVISPPRLIDGRALMRELELPAGPLVGELLEGIREAQADGLVSTPQEALALARELLHQEKT